MARNTTTKASEPDADAPEVGVGPIGTGAPVEDVVEDAAPPAELTEDDKAEIAARFDEIEDLFEDTRYGERIPDNDDIDVIAQLANADGATLLDDRVIAKLRRMICVYADQFKGVADA